MLNKIQFGLVIVCLAPPLLEGLLAKLLPGAVHQAEVKHQHAVPVLKVDVAVIEADVVEHLLRKRPLVPISVLGKLEPLHGNIVSRGKRPENSSFAKDETSNMGKPYTNLLQGVGVVRGPQSLSPG